MRNLAQRVTSEYFTSEEFRIKARPSLAGSEAPASVEITFIFILRAAVVVLRCGGRVRILTGNLVYLPVGNIIKRPTTTKTTPIRCILNLKNNINREPIHTCHCCHCYMFTTNTQLRPGVYSTEPIYCLDTRTYSMSFRYFIIA